MTADQFPSDVPVPEPYDIDAPNINYASVYGAEMGRLHALGYPFDPSVVGGLQFYVAFSRAMNELERLRALQKEPQ